MFCATGGICLVSRSEQAAGSFVTGWGTGQDLLTERTYEHQQHPASFNGEYRTHSYNMAALSCDLTGRTISFLRTDLTLSKIYIRLGCLEKQFLSDRRKDKMQL